MHPKSRYPVCILLLLVTAVFAGCHTKNTSGPPATRTGFFFDTFIQISLYDTADETILDGCMELANRYEGLLSRTKEHTDIRRINEAKGAAVTVDSETVALLQTALSYAERTNGVFDPTIGAVSSLWNFSQEPKGPVPEDSVIREALLHVGYEKLHVDAEKNTVQLEDPDMRLDLGAIAKGYIADRIKEFLLSKGVKSALINLGGNVLAIGEKPGGEAFRVGVQKPFDTQGSVITTVSVKDKSLVSSGNYERCFEEDGVLYHHILDPATGYPSDSGILGVTILADRSVDADALSTICFLMGPQRAMELIEQTEGAEALLITGDPGDPSHYQITTSSGFPAQNG